MITVKRKLNVQIVARGRKTIRPHDANIDSANKTKPPARIPRIARLMALAIHYQEMLRTGEATDMIELSRRAKVSQPRMSQIMALKLLAPDIQTTLLDLPPQSKGKVPRLPVAARLFSGCCVCVSPLVYNSSSIHALTSRCRPLMPDLTISSTRRAT